MVEAQTLRVPGLVTADQLTAPTMPRDRKQMLAQLQERGAVISKQAHRADAPEYSSRVNLGTLDPTKPQDWSAGLRRYDFAHCQAADLIAKLLGKNYLDTLAQAIEGSATESHSGMGPEGSEISPSELAESLRTLKRFLVEVNAFLTSTSRPTSRIDHAFVRIEPELQSAFNIFYNPQIRPLIIQGAKRNSGNPNLFNAANALYQYLDSVVQQYDRSRETTRARRFAANQEQN